MEETQIKEAEPIEKKRTPPTEAFTALSEELKAIPEPENQLKRTLDFMEQALSQDSGVPHFKNFWDARDVCLGLFKGQLSHQAREVFWARYSELSKEARRLKDILDEQSAFAMEQIEIAIAALEEEMGTLDKQRGEQKPLSLGVESKTLEKTLPFYCDSQAELNLLNAFAARVNAMRKELIKTDMRVRHKNKFFQRLSAIGDHIFPRRKDLIAKISDQFAADVAHFFNTKFEGGQPREPSFVLRDEIKALQGMAKVLTLNTHAFTTTRAQLSESWDRVKEIAKERKAARQQYQEQLRQNTEEFQTKIDAAAKDFAEGTTTVQQATQAFAAIQDEMRQVKLGRDEINHLRDALKQAREPINQKLDEERKAHEEALKEQERQRREKFESFKESIQSFTAEAASLDAEAIIEKRNALKEQMEDFRKPEKRELELLLKPLGDVIQEKREQALMNLSADDQQALSQLREVLDQRHQRRQEIKEQLEKLRKEVSTSGLDFEKAMRINEQINVERERLEKINQGIEEIVEKIEELESKVY